MSEYDALLTVGAPSEYDALLQVAAPASSGGEYDALLDEGDLLQVDPLVAPKEGSEPSGVGDDFTNVGRAFKRGALGAEQAFFGAGASQMPVAMVEADKARGALAEFDQMVEANPNLKNSPQFFTQRNTLVGKIAQQEALAQQGQKFFGSSIKKIGELERQKSAIPITGGLKEFHEGDWKNALLTNPVEVVAGLTAESLPYMAPGMLLMATAGPGAGAAAIGYSSFAVENSASFLQSMQNQGVDLKDEESMRSFLETPERINEAREFAVKRGVPIAFFDAATAGLAGKVLGGAVRSGAGKTVIASAVGVEGAMQVGGGVIGEASGQKLSTGKVEDIRSVVAEGVAEFSSSPVEIVGGMRAAEEAAKVAAQRRAPQSGQTAPVEPTAPTVDEDVEVISRAAAAITPEQQISAAVIGADPIELRKQEAIVDGTPPPAVVEEAPVEEELVTTPTQKALEDVQIPNIDEIVANEGGTVRVTYQGEDVDFTDFVIVLEGDSAEVLKVKVADRGEASKGIGTLAYIQLGNQLAERGITLRSSNAQYADGRKLWDRLVAQGHAERTGSGQYQWKSATPEAVEAPLASQEGQDTTQAPPEATAAPEGLTVLEPDSYERLADEPVAEGNVAYQDQETNEVFQVPRNSSPEEIQRVVQTVRKNEELVRLREQEAQERAALLSQDPSKPIPATPEPPQTFPADPSPEDKKAMSRLEKAGWSREVLPSGNVRMYPTQEGAADIRFSRNMETKRERDGLNRKSLVPAGPVREVWDVADNLKFQLERQEMNLRRAEAGTLKDSDGKRISPETLRKGVEEMRARLNELQPKVEEAKKAVKGMKKNPRTGEAGFVTLPQPLVDLGIALHRGGVEFREWSRSMLKNVGDQVRPFLKQIWDAVVKAMDALAPANRRALSTSGMRRSASTEGGAIGSAGGRRAPDPVPEGPDRRQVFGRRAGQVYERTAIKPIQDAVRAQIFDGTQPVSPEATDKAMNLVHEWMSGPNNRVVAVMAEVHPQAASVAKAELYRYAMNMTAQGDPSLQRFILENDSHMGVTAPGRSISEAEMGLTLRLRQLMDHPAWKIMSEVAAEAEKITEEVLGGKEAIDALKTELGRINLSPEDLLKGLEGIQDKGGQKLNDLLGKLVSSDQAKKARKSKATPAPEAAPEETPALTVGETKEAFRKMMEEALKGSAPKKSATPTKTLTERLNERADQARKTLRESRQFLGSGIPNPLLLVEVAWIGASHIANGATTLAAYTTKIIDEFGEKMRPFIDDLWTQSNALYEAERDGRKVRKPRERKASPESEAATQAAEEAEEEFNREAEATAVSIIDRFDESQTETIWETPAKRNAVRDLINGEMRGQFPLPDAAQKWSQYIRPLSDRIQALGVRPEIATRLALTTYDQLRTSRASKTWKAMEEAKAKAERQAKLDADRAAQKAATQASRDANKAATQAERVANAPTKTAEQILDGFEQSQTEWVKPDAKKNAIRGLIKSWVNGQQPLPEDSNKWSDFIKPLTDQLVILGVKFPQAQALAQATYDQLVNRRSAVRQKAMQRAFDQGNVAPIIEAILDTPLSKRTGNWVHRTALSFFEEAGLTPELAATAARVFAREINQKFEQAADRALQNFVKLSTPFSDRLNSPSKTVRTKAEREFERLRQAVRLQATDPSKTFTSTVAQQNNWKGFTDAQHKRMTEIDARMSDPDILITEYVKLHNEMLDIARNAKLPPTRMDAIAESFNASALSSLSTLGVNLYGPVGEVLGQFMANNVAAFLPNGGGIGQVIYNITQLANAITSMPREASYAIKNDTYRIQADETLLHTRALKSLMESARKDWESGNAVRMSKALVKLPFATMDYVRRILNTFDQMNFSGMEQYGRALYGSKAMRMRGYNTQDIFALQAAADSVFASTYQDAVDAGMNKEDATMRAKDAVRDAYLVGLGNKTSPEDSQMVAQAAKQDALLTLGRKEGQIKEGFLSELSGINAFLDFMSKMRSEGTPVQRILSTVIYGFVRTPFQLAKYGANYTPYGMFRYGLTKSRQSRGLEGPWQQSLGTDLQARQRLIQSIGGTIATGMAIGMMTGSGDEDKRKGMKIVITGGGPDYGDPTYRDAWLKEHKPHSIEFWAGGNRKVALPYARGGVEGLAYIFAAAGALDDYELKHGKKAVTGAEKNLNKYAEFALNYVLTAMERGASFGGRNSLHDTFRKNSGSFASKAGSMVSRSVAPLVPGSGMIRSIETIMMSPRDRSSAFAAMVAGNPITAPFGQPAINGLGDRTQDVTAYGRGLQAGMPVLVQNVESDPIYRLIGDKMVAPTALKRSEMERKVGGPFSEKEWRSVAEYYGTRLKDLLYENFESLDAADPKEADGLMTKLAAQAKRETLEQL